MKGLLAAAAAGRSPMARGDGQEHGVADDAAHRHGEEGAPGRVAARVDGLLGDVRAGVVAGERPLRLQQADEEGVDVGPVLAGEASEQEGGVVLRRQHRQRAHQQRHAGEVVPGREPVEDADRAHADVVQRAMADEDHRVDAERRAASLGQPEHDHQELGQAVVDAGGDRELADGVQPGGDPPVAATAEDRRPVVEGAGGGIRGGELGEAGGDGEGHHGHQRPARGHHQRSPEAQAVAVERHRAGEHADDGEGEGEAREPAHVAEELLHVAEARQLRGVAILLARARVLAHRSAPLTPQSPSALTTRRFFRWPSNSA